MKNLFAKAVSLVFALVFLLLSVGTVSVFAADDDNTLVINSDAKVKVGDKVKYTLYLSDTKEDIVGFEMRLFYDHNYLKLEKDSISYSKFDGVVQNLDIQDKIPFNWTNVSNPVSFSNKAEFISLSFKVLKGGETEISQFVSEMYGKDLTSLKSYKWTYDISVNDKSIVKDKTPVISKDENTLNNKQGGFINYIDGMGEENSPNKDNHQAVVGVVNGTQIATKYIDVTKNGGALTGDGGFWIMTILVVVAVLLVIGAIIVILIIKRREDVKLSS